ncbi:hypothetical protein Nmel_015241 [Mimus melanotis]
MLKTIKAAAPKQRYVKITQGPKEPFLIFVEKIVAALEKQVEDDNLRQLLCKQLAKDNANVDCLKIIQALPGDPSLTDMIQACATVGTIDHEITTIAAAVWQQQKLSGVVTRSKGKRMVKSRKSHSSNRLIIGLSFCVRNVKNLDIMLINARQKTLC